MNDYDCDSLEWYRDLHKHLTLDSDPIPPPLTPLVGRKFLFKDVSRERMPESKNQLQRAHRLATAVDSFLQGIYSRDELQLEWKKWAKTTSTLKE